MYLDLCLVKENCKLNQVKFCYKSFVTSKSLTIMDKMAHCYVLLSILRWRSPRNIGDSPAAQQVF